MGLEYMPFEKEFPIVFGWAIDLIKAIEERPWWARLLLRLIVGKYSFSEYMGLRDHLAKHHYINDGYGLEDMDYHKKHIPIFWWRGPIEN